MIRKLTLEAWTRRAEQLQAMGEFAYAATLRSVLMGAGGAGTAPPGMTVLELSIPERMAQAFERIEAIEAGS